MLKFTIHLSSSGNAYRAITCSCISSCRRQTLQATSIASNQASYRALTHHPRPLQLLPSGRDKRHYNNRDTVLPPPYGTVVKPEWPVLPIMQTCSLFRDLMIPHIYRDVYLLGDTSVEKFCSQPASTSYRYLNELVIRGADGEADIPTKWRVICHLLDLMSEEAKASGYFVFSPDKAEETRSSSSRFRIGTVRLRGASMNLAPGLLSM